MVVFLAISPQFFEVNVIMRLFDIVLSFTGLAFSFPLMFTFFIIGLFDTGSPLFFQTRVGRQQMPFTLVKFRTMRKDTASVASHLASSNAITPYGAFLRKTKLDELPQLWNVLIGDMSLVGPRPGLFNQPELLEWRDKMGVFNVRPGITGLAQISEIDMSTPELLAKTDRQMIDTLTVTKYFSYIIQTVAGKGQGDRVQ